jgi:hypothetical protein
VPRYHALDLAGDGLGGCAVKRGGIRHARIIRQLCQRLNRNDRQGWRSGRGDAAMPEIAFDKERSNSYFNQMFNKETGV